MPRDSTQQRAISALLDPENRTLTQAAASAGISRKTLYSCLHDDAEFLKAYQRQRDQLTVEHAEALAQKRAEALGVIESLMLDNTLPAAVRLKAAAQLLQSAGDAQARADAALKAIDFQNNWF